MRVVQLIDTLNVGGAERMTVNMANTFTEKGIPNAILCTRQSGALQKDLMQEVQLFCAQKKHSLDILAFYRGFKFIRSINPDILHAHSSSLFWGVLYALFCSKCILIWHDHNGKRPKLGILKNLPFQLASLRVNAVISVNDDLKQWAVKNLFVNKNRIKYLKNFPCLNLPKEKRNRKELIILMVANLHEPKDHHTLMRAVILLIKAGKKNFKLVCLGKLNETSEYTQTLKSYISKNNLEPYVNLLGQAPVESALSMANIGVIISKSEGLPISLLEYGLASLPVVITNVGQCAEVVGNGQYGYVVPPQAPDELALALTHILDNYESALKMGERFQQHVLNEYGSGRFLQEYKALIEKL